MESHNSKLIAQFSIALLRQLGVTSIVDSTGRRTLDAVALAESSEGFVNDIAQHATGICRYLSGDNEVNADFDLRQGSLWLFLITESIHYALLKGDNLTEIDTSKLIELDYDYLEDNFMSMITPTVGTEFDPASITKPQEMSSLALKNQARLSGLSILSGLGLNNLEEHQRRLFVGDNTDVELAELISSDIERMTHEALTSWQADISNARSISDVSDSFKRIYSALLQNEFAKMKQEFLYFNDQEKADYKKLLNEIVEGNLIKRTRETINRLTKESVPGVDQGDKNSELN